MPKLIALAVATTIAFIAQSPAQAAIDKCLAAAMAGPDATAGLRGQIVASSLSREGQGDTEVIGTHASEEGLRGREGFRIASITKTYVAATVLRLWEDGRIDLQSPITRWLPPEWMSLLAKDGYDPAKITVRHLLSHTSGLADHAQAPQFIAQIKAHPQTEWTRTIDVQRLVEWTDPVGAPGEKYSYSDTGYVLLGAIVERVTGQTLPQAVRSELALDTLGLPDTYWERYEPARGRTRAHQVYDGIDTYAWSPTMDLYGGGGIVTSMPDVARFFNELLAGKIFKHPGTLTLMESSSGLPANTPYRYGLLTYTFDGTPAIGHSGFWGTFVVQEPTSGQTVAVAVTDHADIPGLKAIIKDYVHRAAAGGPTSACYR